MGRRQLLYLLCTSSARPPSFTPYFAAPPHLLFRKGYSHERSTGNHAADETINHERAPSTLEEFKRLEEEKASQEVASQKAEKGRAGVMEAATGEGSVKSVKESYKNGAGKAGDFESTQ